MENKKINIEQFSNIELDQDTVGSISKKCNEYKSLLQEIEDKDKEISELKKKGQRI